MAKNDVQQGTLALMAPKPLDVLGTLYPVLLKREQEGSISSEWGTSENNRRARFYRLTRVGGKQLQVETRVWAVTAAVIDRFFAVKAEDLQ